MKFALPFLLLAAFSAANLMAQRPVATNPGTSTSPGGITSPGNNLPTQPSIPSTTSPSNPGINPEASVPIFLSGKVIVDDGSPVPANIAIQRVCSGNPRTVAWTDSKGRFNFQWGDSISAGVPDATESGRGLGRMNGNMGSSGMGANVRGDDPMIGCELRASFVGYSSDSINLSGHRALDNPEVGTVVLHRLANVEGTSVSVTALNAPKDAAKAYEKGLQSLHKSKTDDAAKEFAKAVQIYPKYANAWLDLGRVQLEQQMVEAARESFKKATEADGKLVEPWAQLGLLAAKEAKWVDAGQYLDRALQLDPVDFPQLWFPDAVAGYNLQHFDAAEKSAREALKADPEHRNPRTEQLLGLILLQKQQYAEAGDALRNYLQFSPNAPDLDQVRTQLTQIDQMVKKPK